MFLRGCPAAADLVLIVSEFSANAVTHSRSGQPGGMFDVHAEATPGDRVLVRVADDGGRWSGPCHEDGRPHGLDLVRILCGPGSWGITGSQAGRTAWAFLRWEGGAGA